MDDITASWNALAAQPKHVRSAHRAEAVLFDYRQATQAPDEEDETVLTDLLTDLMHYADAHDLNFDDALNGAHIHHTMEAP